MYLECYVKLVTFIINYYMQNVIFNNDTNCHMYTNYDCNC